MSFAMWTPISTPPKKAGTCLVGNQDTNQVYVARYMPIKRERMKTASGTQDADTCLNSRQMDQPRTNLGFAPIAGARFQYLKGSKNEN